MPLAMGTTLPAAETHLDARHIEEFDDWEVVAAGLHLHTDELELQRQGWPSGSSHLRHGSPACDCEGLEGVDDLLQELQDSRTSAGAAPRTGVEKCSGGNLGNERRRRPEAAAQRVGQRPPGHVCTRPWRSPTPRTRTGTTTRRPTRPVGVRARSALATRPPRFLATNSPRARGAKPPPCE